MTMIHNVRSSPYRIGSTLSQFPGMPPINHSRFHIQKHPKTTKTLLDNNGQYYQSKTVLDNYGLYYGLNNYGQLLTVCAIVVKGLGK